MVKRIKRKELPKDVAEGVREQTDYEKFVSEQAPVEEKEPDKSKFENTDIVSGLGRSAGRAKDMGGVGGFATNLVAAPLRGAERLALEFLDVVGVGSDEEIEDARQQLNLGREAIYKDPDVQDLALTVGLAGVGKAIGVAKGATKISTKVTPKVATPNVARITKMVSAHKRDPLTGSLLPRGTKQTQWMVKNPKTTERMAKFLRKMDQPSKAQLVRKGTNWVKNNKAKAFAGATLAGANATWYWGASDNLSTMASMRVNEAVDAVRFSGLPKSHAKSTIEQAKSQVNLALTFQVASQLNPLVSLTGGWVMIGNTLATKKAIEEQERNLALL